MTKTITLKYGHEMEKAAEITAMLQEVEKRCSARTIDRISLVEITLEDVNKHCPIKAKGMRAGLQFCVDPNGQTFPKAYKYTPESTLMYGEYTKTGMKIWFGRDTTRKDREPEYYNFNEEQILDVLETAGVKTGKVQKAFNHYKNGTGCTING